MLWDGDNLSDHHEMPEKMITSSYNHAAEIARAPKVAKQGHYHEYWKGKQSYNSNQTGEAWGYYNTNKYSEQTHDECPPDESSPTFGQDDTPDPDLEESAKVDCTMRHI